MSSGHGMAPGVRGGFEELFGTGFAGVRIHEGILGEGGFGTRRAACAHGADVAFGPGDYDPYSARGRELIGHELAHVLQQRYGRVRPGGPAAALEAEAIAAGRRIALGLPVRIPGAPRPGTGRGRAVTQFYTPHAAGGGAPFVVVGGAHHAPVQPQDSFIVQAKAPGGQSFMTGGAAPVVRLEATDPAAVTLRVSDNQRMAVEHCDLGLRQPKCFYATQAIVDASNARLALINSRFRLVADPPGPNQRRITIGANTLLRVLPRNHVSGVTGLAMQCNQPCNEMVSHVIAAPFPAPRFENDPHVPPHHMIEYHVARALLPPPQPPVLDDTSLVTVADTARTIASAYGAAAHAPTPGFTADLRTFGLNDHVAPAVGEAFLTVGLVVTAPTVGLAQGSYPTQTDFYRPTALGVNPVLLSSRTWGDHWAGVVAADGSDVITLENYARNAEDAIPSPDERYYFQMYQTDPAAPGTTWHTAWTTVPMIPIPAPIPVVPAPHPAPTHQPATPGVRSFANPLTMRVTGPVTRWNTIADTLYGAVATNTIWDAYGNIAGAADADAEIREVLKGLRYANVQLGLADRGSKVRNDAWVLALTHAVAAARFPENVQALLHTHERVVRLVR
ncbi:hypothetical protein B4N89_44680 [Embleya scabrispora]|uniref:eCIS core domain-containing protein n=1 Tax=Embleya scabrispora TaxID=159449 RepID=A0A1T3NL70_9ACTN|nr:DUF4157 domain-containing protein [Embleya scabrispora]OPC77587.1 hypothetical protein B4N89_44680 [Embleya scabrispora]